MTKHVDRLTPRVTVPAFLIRNREQELAEAYAEIDRLKDELAALKGKDWSVRDSIIY